MVVEYAAARIADVYTRPLKVDNSVRAGRLCLAVRQRQTQEEKNDADNLHGRAAEARGKFSVSLHRGISHSNLSVLLFSPIRAKSSPRELVRKTLVMQDVN